MAETKHDPDETKKVSGDQPLFDTGVPPFQGGIHPVDMGADKSPIAGMPSGVKMPTDLDGKPPEGWKPPPADISWVVRKYLDLPYDTLSKAQCLDIFLPDNGTGPFPVILQIHGGAFAIGDKRDMHLLPFLRGIGRGYAVVSVNYRLSAEAIFPAAVQDVRSAVRWIRTNQAQYHLDGKRIGACGGSAGGNLAAMLGVTGQTFEFDDPRLGDTGLSPEVEVVVDWFGPIDFLVMDEQLAQNGFGISDHNEPSSPESRYMGAPIQEVSERARLANPTTYIHPNLPPFFIQHGRIDRLVPVQQSINFHQALGKVLQPANLKFEILEGAGHGDPLFETDFNMEKVFSFLDANLKI